MLRPLRPGEDVNARIPRIPEEIVNMKGIISKVRVLRYCPGWDRKEHPVKIPDGKEPGELCNPCLSCMKQASR